MSVLAIVLIALGVAILLVLVGGVIAVRRRARREDASGTFERHLADADQALEAARAADKGWDRAVMERAAREGGATVLNAYCHRFTPQGVTVLLALSESHASIHTYPEYGACMVDVFTCGGVDPWEIALAVVGGLGGGVWRVSRCTRGGDDPPRVDREEQRVHVAAATHVQQAAPAAAHPTAGAD